MGLAAWVLLAVPWLGIRVAYGQETQPAATQPDGAGASRTLTGDLLPLLNAFGEPNLAGLHELLKHGGGNLTRLHILDAGPTLNLGGLTVRLPLSGTLRRTDVNAAWRGKLSGQVRWPLAPGLLARYALHVDPEAGSRIELEAASELGHLKATWRSPPLVELARQDRFTGTLNWQLQSRLRQAFTDPLLGEPWQLNATVRSEGEARFDLPWVWSDPELARPDVTIKPLRLSSLRNRLHHPPTGLTMQSLAISLQGSGVYRDGKLRLVFGPGSHAALGLVQPHRWFRLESERPDDDLLTLQPAQPQPATAPKSADASGESPWLELTYDSTEPRNPWRARLNPTDIKLNPSRLTVRHPAQLAPLRLEQATLAGRITAELDAANGASVDLAGPIAVRAAGGTWGDPEGEPTRIAPVHAELRSDPPRPLFNRIREARHDRRRFRGSLQFVQPLSLSGSGHAAFMAPTELRLDFELLPAGQ